MMNKNLMGKIEALLFIASSPVSENELKSALNVSIDEVKSALGDLKIILEDGIHGICLKQLAGNWTLETKPELADLIGNFRSTAKIKRVYLSKPAMEILTIIAYKQPITRREIEELRGVESSTPITKLMELGLIRISGRKDRRAALYSTTRKFLELFGINSLENLPAIDEIEFDEKKIDELDEAEEFTGENVEPDEEIKEVSQT